MVRATPETLDEMNKNGVLLGDALFYHRSRSLASWAVMYYTSGPESHVATAMGDGRVFDATTRGVIFHPMKDYFDGRGYVMILRLPRLVTSAEQEREVRARMDAQIGAPFDWRGVIWLWITYVCGADTSYRARFTVDFSGPLLRPYVSGLAGSGSRV